MKLYFFVGVLIVAVSACQSNNKVSVENIETNINLVSKAPETKIDGDELVGFFTDSSSIGTPNKNKIEFSNIKKVDGFFAVIKFYSLDADKNWNLKQQFEFENIGFNCNPKLNDFNNDGLKDFTYISALAARGANEIRKLFIYDKKNDELLYIKNSENYPNMLYNKDLDCIDAWLVSGGTSTVFLKIDGDSLKEFAKVETSEISRTV